MWLSACPDLKFRCTILEFCPHDKLHLIHILLPDFTLQKGTDAFLVWDFKKAVRKYPDLALKLDALWLFLTRSRDFFMNSENIDMCYLFLNSVYSIVNIFCPT